MRACVVLALLILGHAGAAHAEANELAVGMSGGVMLPAFSAPSPTAFTLATWSAGVEASYGVADPLSIRAAFTFATFSGSANAQQVAHGDRSYTGNMAFDGVYYHPEVGARLKVFGGYNLAPYVELNGGYLWGVYNRAAVSSTDGGAVAVGDFAQGSATLGAGVALDYRLLNVLFAGVAARYVHVFGRALATHYVSVPLTVSYYW